MLFEILLFSILGILTGVLTGLIPGLHPNTVITILISFSPVLLANFSVMEVAILILSMAVTNSIVDFIPSILLGAPESDTSLGVLPGHRFLLEGKSYDAIRLTVLGGITSLAFIFTILIFIFPYIPMFYDIMKSYIPYILMGMVILSLIKSKRKLWAIITFILSGTLGILVLNHGILNSDFVFFPLLTGLFGLSILFDSVRRTPNIPEQNKEGLVVSPKKIGKSGLIGTLSGFLVGFLPGIGAAQAAFLSQHGFKSDDERSFMMAIGGVNTTNIILSIFALWLIGKPRSGAGVAIQKVLNTIIFSDVVIFAGVVILSCSLGAIFTLLISKSMVDIFKKINYRYLCVDIIVFILVMIFILTGMKGVMIALLASSIGLVSILSKSRKSFLMGCLIIPTILLQLGVI
ncbi:MAG: tripartite tricarboxylate transporter permease [Candidatus Aenigmatarchaeota archaeon]